MNEEAITPGNIQPDANLKITSPGPQTPNVRFF